MGVQVPRAAHNKRQHIKQCLQIISQTFKPSGVKILSMQQTPRYACAHRQVASCEAEYSVLLWIQTTTTGLLCIRGSRLAELILGDSKSSDTCGLSRLIHANIFLPSDCLIAATLGYELIPFSTGHGLLPFTPNIFVVILSSVLSFETMNKCRRPFLVVFLHARRHLDGCPISWKSLLLIR